MLIRPPVAVALIALLLCAAATTQPFAPLPKPPNGFQLRQVAEFPTPPVRIASHNDSIYVLTLDGDLYQLEPLKKLVVHDTYAGGDNLQCLGLTIDRDGRFYVVVNAFDFNPTPAMNHVTIFRGAPDALKPWFQIDIPFAIDVFQHGVSYIAQGPDGLIYVSSGSRTDHGEAGNDPKRSKEGETPVTSCIWRLDPKSEHPQIEVFARGLRNAFGFCFDRNGTMWATENGPNADPPEEMNCVEQAKHYGFPYQFADWDHPAYPDQPKAPAGLKMEPPFAMFDPHSSPSGIVYLDDRFPEKYRGTFLVARFGNLIGPRDVGFDILRVQNEHGHGTVSPFLSPIARPTDLHMTASGKIYIAELWRQTHNAGEQSPGRVLELSVSR
jgi:hypothetical protein